MPTYPYKCLHCAATKELTTSINEYGNGLVVECRCGETMHRTYQAPSFTIQGLAGDRFKYRDKIAANRQAVIDKGMPDDLG